ncbi:TetR/AcrR family transcriptional regulator [Luteipulveratus halotolerans]|uniref:HTH tetR-type domain-containing protein n=1 Tax=Luteipulveratus halotolerans TaxID=1631356 RepID=A0A0L6CLX2_9MICO|nr:TetR/AcrR family transcriptional regulator [Luteipulveratus halotolerans]KNX38630.1 hypothetical protein VV01_18175 [Luteipulveratus halotolerans]
MARPTKHDPQQLVDAAIALYAEKGASAVTMTAVAARAGAPNGSMYHRFPGRGSLLAAMWLRAVRSMHETVHDAVGDVAGISDDPVAAAGEAAAALGCWCVERPAMASVLFAGRAAYDPETWPAADRELALAEQREFDAHASDLVRALLATGIPRAVVDLALLDLPYAGVRRYLAERVPVPDAVPEIIRGSVVAILRDHQPR